MIAQIRVKEYNYFDAMPVLTMKQDVLKTSALDYSSVAVGEVHTATITAVNESKKQVTLSLNDFVKGTLSITHMADHPLKVMPPKFCQEGKQIKVRVFNVEKRAIEFTKKDSLMKDKAPVYSSITEVR